MPGTPSSVWDITGDGDETIQGYATDISVNRGSTVTFKIDTNASAYTIDIYRMGYYQGNGARKITSITPSATLPQIQPSCLKDATTGLVDCGNWAPSASWAVPATATSGIYFALLTRTDTGGKSQIEFIVRDDSSHSDLLFQTSDATWEAYNDYGGNSLYDEGFDKSTAVHMVSYNRPFRTRNDFQTSWVFNAEYPMVRWLESNGYDVSYFTDVDSDRYGSLIKNHKVFLSVGHDEYWSAAQRQNVTAARDAGVNLAFFSGNEIFWKTRWQSSIDGSNTPYRTLVTYKETNNGPIDPMDPPIWTGTWRDNRYSPPADGGLPENALSGTIFMVNGEGGDELSNETDPMDVPYAYSKLRFWRNTAIAQLQPGQTYVMPTGVLGYEWDEDVDNGFRPAGLMDMSSTTLQVGEMVLDPYAYQMGPGTATHSLTLYRAASGALVFGAGTVQWSWGLDANHDRSGTPTDINMQQATVNLLADMHAQPATLQPGLVPATASTDTTPPTSHITSPATNTTVQTGGALTVTGTATDAGGGVVSAVEVSTDDGQTWHPATGTSSWSYTFTPQTIGKETILSRAWDDSGNGETPNAGIVLNVIGPTCPCTLWSTSTTPAVIDDGDPGGFELGMKFRAQVSGYVMGLRFYKASANTGTHLGDLWDSAGNLLATATFTNETASGWQTVSFANPVPINPNTTYIVSYHTTTGHFSVNRGYFTGTYANAPLLGLASGLDGLNGVFFQGGSAFPTASYAQSNYWVDPIFTTTYDPSTEPPYIMASSPQAGATGVSVTTTVTATFSKAMDAATITNGGVSLQGPGGAAVPATVTYNATTNGATLTPQSALAAGTMYTAQVAGGSSGVLDTNGNPIPSTDSWSFTTSGPPSVTSVSPAANSSGASEQPQVAVTFSEAMLATSITSTSIQLMDANNNAVAAKVSYSAATNTATLQPTTLLTLGATYSAVVHSGSSGVQNAAGTPMSADYTWSFNVKQCPCSLWDNTTTPSVTSVSDVGAYELGMKFTVDSSGYITAVRFYKGAQDTSTHYVHLWDSSGNLLATALSINETASGWQTVTFDTPVAVSANATYTVSYHTDVGHFAVDRPYFTSGNSAAFNNAPVHALVDSSGAPNGVYATGATVFPTATYNSSNYWVDPVFTNVLPPDTTPPTVIAVAPTNGATSVGPGAPLTATFSKAMDPATITSGTVQLHDGNGNVVPATVSYSAQTHIVQLTANAPLALGAIYSIVIHSGANGVKDLASDLPMAGDYSWSFTTQACPCSVFSPSATPGTLNSGDTSAYELGMKFQVSVPGYITGVRFYKGSLNTGTHLGDLWDSAGNLLATATFANETASGWQTVYFAQPIAVQANTTYTVSYHTTSGNYSLDRPFFSSGNSAAYSNGVIHALSDGQQGGNGVFASGASAFPTGSYDAGNYWVDAIFTTTPFGTAPTVTSVSPAAGATNASLALAVTTTFSQAMDPTSITSSTAQLRDASGTVVPATVSYSSASNTLTLTPSATVASGATYTAVVKGGTSGVLNQGEVAMAGDYSWSFTTQACPCSVFSPSATPGALNSGDTSAYELGMKFQVSVPGYITGVRFYKGSLNTGTHLGDLWDSAGNLLATATFANETASGWQTVYFAQPIAVQANTTYTVSYHTTSGNYSLDRPFFSSGNSAAYSNGVIHALSDGQQGGNGVFASGASAFPTGSYDAGNYWVDAIFTTTP